jgi:glycine cleavage system pyridoxal-binding protein P
MGHFVPHTDAEIEAMLDFLGLSTLDDLFAHIPAAVRLAGGLNLAPGRSEADVIGELAGLGDFNRACVAPPGARPGAASGGGTAAGGGRGLVCFAGGGSYDHDIPSAVRALAGRSEFVTSYTPYQPELAQGVLQALFEYQTMLCRLTGMDVANASLYDGAAAAVEGMNLAAAATGRRTVWLSRGVRPEVRAVIRTLCGARLDVREALFRLPQNLQAAEVVHDQVGDDEVVRPLVDEAEGLGPGGGRVAPVAGAGEHLGRRLGVALLVVDDQDTNLGGIHRLEIPIQGRVMPQPSAATPS